MQVKNSIWNKKSKKNMTPASRLKEIIADSELNQEKFAKSVGVSQSVISKYLAGRNLDSEVIIKLKEVYKVNANWLLSGELPKYLNQSTPSIRMSFDANDRPVMERFDSPLGTLTEEEINLIKLNRRMKQEDEKKAAKKSKKS